MQDWHYRKSKISKVVTTTFVTITTAHRGAVSLVPIQHEAIVWFIMQNLRLGVSGLILVDVLILPFHLESIFYNVHNK